MLNSVHTNENRRADFSAIMENHYDIFTLINSDHATTTRHSFSLSG